MAIERIDVTYCEGWDPVARAAAGALSTRLAFERHQTGDQYAALMFVAGRPVGLIEVAAGDRYVGAWFLDGEFRRVSEVDCRLAIVASTNTSAQPGSSGSGWMSNGITGMTDSVLSVVGAAGIEPATPSL